MSKSDEILSKLLYTKKKRNTRQSNLLKEKGLFPRLKNILIVLQNMIEIQEGIPFPKPNINEEYDWAFNKVK